MPFWGLFGCSGTMSLRGDELDSTFLEDSLGALSKP